MGKAEAIQQLPQLQTLVDAERVGNAAQGSKAGWQGVEVFRMAFHRPVIIPHAVCHLLEDQLSDG